MWPFSTITKLRIKNQNAKELIQTYEQEIDWQRKAISEMEEELDSQKKHFETILDHHITEKDIDIFFQNRLNFLDDRIDEFEGHNVPELASQVFLRKQEAADIYAIFKTIIQDKENKKEKDIEECIKQAMQKQLGI